MGVKGFGSTTWGFGDVSTSVTTPAVATMSLGNETVNAAANVSAATNIGTSAIGTVSVSGAANTTVTGSAATSAIDRLQRLAITTFLLPDWSGQQLSRPLSQLQMQIFTRQAHQRLAHVVKSWYGPILIPHRVLLGLQYLQHSPHLGARLSRRSA